MRWSITYSKTTPGSAMYGDSSEHGWWMPGGWTYALSGAEDGVSHAAATGAFDQVGTLRDLVDMAKSLGICTCDGAEWFYSIDGCEDPTTGERTNYCLHLHETSARHFSRVAKFIN